MSRALRVPSAILVSGNGTNLQAVLDEARAGRLPLDVTLVVSNVPGVRALERARTAGVPAVVVEWHRASESRSRYGARLAETVKASGARLVLLLGWMHVLSREFLDAGFDGVLNLHPSYLPDDPDADEVTLPDGSRSPVFRGAHALRDALERGAPFTGATLIEISPRVDRGTVLARREFALHADDDEASALERLHRVEHEVVIEGIRSWLLAKGLAAVR